MKSPTHQFIEDCLAGGYRKENPDFSAPQSLALLLLDPLAWQAVGKTRGWDRPVIWWRRAENWTDETYSESTRRWVNEMHNFIDHLADGKTIEEALTAISV